MCTDRNRCISCRYGVMPCELTIYVPNFLPMQHDPAIIKYSQEDGVDLKQEEEEADDEYNDDEDQLKAAIAASLAHHTTTNSSSSRSKTQREDCGSASKKIQTEVRFSSLPSRSSLPKHTCLKSRR